jgi:acetate kinase
VNQAVLTVNAGSSSIKCALFNACDERTLRAIVRAEVDGIGHAPRLHVAGAQSATAAERVLGAAVTYEEIFAELLGWIDDAFPTTRIVAAGHRVVHGGERFSEPTLVNLAVRAALDLLVPLAPLHQPHNLAAIDALGRLHPDLPQIACFDTAFHVGQAWEATVFALPAELREQGIRRYGFHGLSYEFIASALPEYLGDGADGRVIVAHLGSGASMCAMRRRRSVATTMGFTALDGLPMGTRSGALDPGVSLYLLNQGWSVERLSDMLWRHSGLLGLSGISDDARTLTASEDARAARALAYFSYRAARELASLTIDLGGLDALVFTAGIGEHAPTIRARICELASCLGISLNAQANANNAARISDASSRVTVLVIPTDEESVVARGTLESLGAVKPLFCAQAERP